MNTPLSFAGLFERHPDEAALLEEIKNLRFPNGIECDNCFKITPHYRLRKRKAYQCAVYLHQVYPLAGTIFEKSRTPLWKWYVVIAFMTETRSGISAKTLQRSINVTYKTAWRMYKQLRTLMDENSGPQLKGPVEADETYVGGLGWNRGRKWWANWHETPKEIVFGVTERGGKVRTAHVEDASLWTLTTQIRNYVEPNSTVYTDKHPSYFQLPKYGYPCVIYSYC